MKTAATRAAPAVTDIATMELVVEHCGHSRHARRPR
jgi:hypothetical protein